VEVTRLCESPRVVAIDDGDADAAAAIDAEAACLDGEPRARHDATLVESARREYLLGRALARRVLGAPLVGAEGPKARGPDGAIDASLAHAGGAAVLVLAPTPDLLVGVDLEPVRAVSEALREGALHTDERRATPDDDSFFRRWTAKEARMKLFGEGLALPPRRLLVDLDAAVVIDTATGERWPYAWTRWRGFVVSWMTAPRPR
jgi:phosphopantetheinyl transferase